MWNMIDCREDEDYNEKYLPEEDSQFVCGYDAAIRDLSAVFFASLDFLDDFESIKDKFDTDKIDLGVILDDNDIDEYTDKELSDMTFETRLVKTLQSAFLFFAEIGRDEMITSMIDNMDDETYQKLKAQSLSGKYKNAIVRQQEYVEKWRKGEIPTSWELKIDQETDKIIKIGHCPNGKMVIINE